jgi:hypothetical protein
MCAIVPSFAQIHRVAKLGRDTADMINVKKLISKLMGMARCG